jgi:hypothetical protein
MPPIDGMDPQTLSAQLLVIDTMLNEEEGRVAAYARDLETQRRREVLQLEEDRRQQGLEHDGWRRKRDEEFVKESIQLDDWLIQRRKRFSAGRVERLTAFKEILKKRLEIAIERARLRQEIEAMTSAS